MQKFSYTLANLIGSHRIKHQEAMSSRTSFKTGGNAQFYCETEKIEELIKIIILAREHEIPITLIGGGTNVLVSDNGIEGLVIKNNCRKFEMMSMMGKVRNRQIDVDKVFLYAEAGALTNQVVRFTIDQGFGGLEYALGLPGTLGGAIATNAEYVKENFFVSEILHKARILTKDGEIKDVDKSYFHFDHAKSNISYTGDIILSLMFVLTPGNKNLLWEKAQIAAKYRTEVQEKMQPYGLTYRSILFDKIVIAQNLFPNLDQLLDHAGIVGENKGDVNFYQNNSNFLLNNGKGTTREAISLLNLVKEKIKNKYNASLDIQIGQIGV